MTTNNKDENDIPARCAGCGELFDDASAGYCKEVDGEWYCALGPCWADACVEADGNGWSKGKEVPCPEHPDADILTPYRVRDGSCVCWVCHEVFAPPWAADGVDYVPPFADDARDRRLGTDAFRVDEELR